jgi:6-phosphofructokinase 2
LHPIATLTMNPALDTASATARIVPAEKLRCSMPRHDPGGGGVNVARAVHKLGGEAVAVLPVGGLAGALIEQLLAEEKVAYRSLAIAGATRQNFTVDEQVTGLQFRFVMPGPTLSACEQGRCLDLLASLAPAPHYIVASGSLPLGVPNNFYAHVAERAKLLGARLILDTSGEALRKSGAGDVYLLKPNLSELSELVGREIGSAPQQEDAARELIAQRRAEIVVVSLGAAGAILADQQGCWRFTSASVPLASTVGAGDSMVAGIVLSLARGKPIQEAVRYGMAAGAAALMLPGTELCRRDDTERLFTQITAPVRCN